ncbi:MAG: hypothetical protein WD473_10670 [Acidimicrobiia bacterium]
MSVLEFIASLTSSLAWPLAACAIAVLFRDQLRRLLDVSGPLRRLKGPGGLEAFYDETAIETKQAAAAALKAAGVAEQPSPLLILDDLEAVARISPRDAVVDASSRIENRLLELLRDNNVEVGDNRSIGTVASVAFKRGLIGESTLQAVLGLRVLRNLAAHGTDEDLDTDRALEFLTLADAVLYSLGSKPA